MPLCSVLEIYTATSAELQVEHKTSLCLEVLGSGGCGVGTLCGLVRGPGALSLSAVDGLGAGAEKTSSTRYCSCSQRVLVCLQPEHIAETMKTLLSFTGETGMCAGGGSWENGLNHHVIAEEAGCEASLEGRQDPCKSGRGRMAQMTNG